MIQYRPTNSLTPVVQNLIIANVIVFIAQYYFASMGRPLEDYGALWSIGSGNFKVWQLVTHLFMHGGISHIFFNMFALWMFGVTLERFWGSKRFLEFYFMCGLLAGIAQLALQNNHLSAIGASGAIMGVMAAFAYLFPNTELFILFIPIPVKAKYAISGLILYDIFGELVPRAGDNIAHYAHLGGAVAGLVIVVFWNRKNRKNFY